MSEPASTDDTTLAAAKSVRRWVKVDIPEETFLHLHDMAHQSRMRITPYLRRFLAEAKYYALTGGEGTRPFSTVESVSDAVPRNLGAMTSADLGQSRAS